MRIIFNILIAYCTLFNHLYGNDSIACSVVRVIASFENGKGSFSTGFIYYNSNYIVTTLHSIAGSKEIWVWSECKNQPEKATLIKVLKEADLALLLVNNLNLSILKEAEVSVNSAKEYKIWGYPHNVAKMQEDEITFSRSLQSTPTLSSILGSSTFKQIRDRIHQQGFPSLGMQIIRISSTIQPGHSGAPIFNSYGQVIGIADGGICGGFSRVNWAIRAKPYLEKLITSNEIITNVPKSSLIELYDVEIDSIYNFISADYNILEDRNNNRMVKTWTGTLGDIVASLPENEKSDAASALKTYNDEYNLNIINDTVVIYENFESKFCLAVPKDAIFYVDSTTGYFVIESGYVKEYYLNVKSDSFNYLKKLADEFDNNMNKLNNWIAQEGSYTEYNLKTEYRYYRIGRDRITPDANVYLNVRADVYNSYLEAEATIRDYNKSNSTNSYRSYTMDVLDRINKMPIVVD